MMHMSSDVLLCHDMRADEEGQPDSDGVVRNRAPEIQWSRRKIQLLRSDVVSLIGDDRKRAIRVICSREPALIGQNSGWVEVDFMELQQSTLRELETCVSFSRKITRRPYNTRSNSPSPEWTYDERLRLCMDINSLSGGKLAKALRIMRATEPSQCQDGAGHVDIDFTNLQPSTLSKLEGYFAYCVWKKSTARNKTNGSPWTNEQKQQLSLDMNLLDENEIGSLIEMIRSREPEHLHETPEYVDIDIKNLQPETLKRLDAFIAASSWRKSRKPYNVENDDSEMDGDGSTENDESEMDSGASTSNNESEMDSDDSTENESEMDEDESEVDSEDDESEVVDEDDESEVVDEDDESEVVDEDDESEVVDEDDELEVVEDGHASTSNNESEVGGGANTANESEVGGGANTVE